MTKKEVKIRNWIKSLFCSHDFRVYAGSDLEMQSNGKWKTVHKWRCRKCGKLQRKKKSIRTIRNS